MRKTVFEGVPAEADEIFAKTFAGQLGIVDENGWPRVVPLNFVYHGGFIYFHGALEGEKFSLFTARPKVCFSAYAEYSYIPSYWRSPNFACPASVYYKSAHVRGIGSIVEDINEKAVATQKLMEKIQPDGGYTPVTADSPVYKKALDEVAIFKIAPEEITVKVKLGQNLPDVVRRSIVDKLRERGSAVDLETVSEIERNLNGK